MKRTYIILLLLLSASLLKAQVYPIYQDTLRVRLNKVVILDPDRFGNDTLLYRYNQMKLYVGNILPYLDKAVRMFHDIETKSAHMSRRQKRQYIKGRQHEIKVNFEDKLRALNRTQGSYLVKAINRNLGTSVYSILKKYNKPLKAYYYRGVASLNGIDLDEKYNPEKNKNFEHIMKSYGY